MSNVSQSVVKNFHLCTILRYYLALNKHRNLKYSRDCQKPLALQAFVYAIAILHFAFLLQPVRLHALAEVRMRDGCDNPLAGTVKFPIEHGPQHLLVLDLHGSQAWLNITNSSLIIEVFKASKHKAVRTKL